MNQQRVPSSNTRHVAVDITPSFAVQTGTMHDGSITIDKAYKSSSRCVCVCVVHINYMPTSLWTHSAISGQTSVNSLTFSSSCSAFYISSSIVQVKENQHPPGSTCCLLSKSCRTVRHTDGEMFVPRGDIKLCRENLLEFDLIHGLCRFKHTHVH